MVEWMRSEKRLCRVDEVRDKAKVVWIRSETRLYGCVDEVRDKAIVV
jgi:hypothetical protein